MDFLGILELVIGIIFIYFLLSIMASAVLEIVANYGKFRANDLRDWVFSTFDKPFNYKKPTFSERIKKFLNKNKADSDPKCLGEEIWHHFTIDGLSRAGKKVSYIPSSEFANALLDIIMSVRFRDIQDDLDVNGDPITKEKIIEQKDIIVNVDSVPDKDKIMRLREAVKVKVLLYKNYSKDELGFAVINTPFLSNDQKSIILQFIRESDSVIEVRRSLEVWFDHAMERLTGGYKRFSQRFLFFTGLLTAFLLNVDTIELVQFLYKNPSTSSKLANMADNAVNDPDYNLAVKKLAISSSIAPGDTTIVNDAVREIKAQANLFRKAKESLLTMNLPIGWKNSDCSGSWQCLKFSLSTPIKIIGIFITGFAISLGATFWFDLLNKLVNLRAAGKKPETADDEELVG